MQNNDSEYLLSLKQQGLALMKGNCLAEAKVLFEKICDASPDDAEAWHHLSGIHIMMGNLDEAGDCCRRLIELRPDYTQARLNLGNIFYLQGNLDAAVKEYQCVLNIDQNDAGVHNNLGTILESLGRFDEATAHYEKSIQINPNIPETQSNLGNILLYYHKDRLSEALDCYQRALRLKPDMVAAHNGLGNLYRFQGKHDEALASFQEALRCDPGNAVVHSNLLYMLCYCPEYDVATLFAEHARWGEAHCRDTTHITAHTNVPDKGKRLRIGYVSADFRNHPVGIFIEQVLSHHDKSRVEIFCYSNHGLRDELTERLRIHADHWRDILAQPDETVAEQVRRDGIDILVDLAGHTAGNRLLTFALKPAPIQVTWLSYVATTGLKTMDYIIADRFIIPPQHECYYVEQVMRLPRGYLCFTPPNLAIEVSPLPAESRKEVTFGCFNNLSKLTPDVIATWSNILRAIPHSRLFLKSTGFNDEETGRHFQKLFSAHGVRDKQLILAGQSPRDEFLAAYSDVDIGLDPFPYNGGTTTVEALWMGVPVVTLSGDRFVSRVGESIMTNLGLEKCVTNSKEDYITEAIALASDLPRLAKLRRGLRSQLLNSPLCDGPGFTRDLEAAYRTMWEAWCQIQPQ